MTHRADCGFVIFRIINPSYRGKTKYCFSLRSLLFQLSNLAKWVFGYKRICGDKQKVMTTP